MDSGNRTGIFPALVSRLLPQTGQATSNPDEDAVFMVLSGFACERSYSPPKDYLTSVSGGLQELDARGVWVVSGRTRLLSLWFRQHDCTNSRPTCIQTPSSPVGWGGMEVSHCQRDASPGSCAIQVGEEACELIARKGGAWEQSPNFSQKTHHNQQGIWEKTVILMR